MAANAAALDTSNFRCDVNASGTINGTDKGIVMANIGNDSPAAPSSTTQAVQYEQDNDGRVTRINIPSAYDQSQTYDPLGRLWQIKSGTTVQHQYAYDKASNVTQRANLVNSTSIDYVPDAVNRIHDLKINVPNQEIPVGGASRNWFTREVYGYDTMNRLTSVQRDEEPDMSDQFGYSLDGQLTTADYGLHWANGQWSNPVRAVDYTLDKAGNRTGAAGVTADGTPFNYAPNGLNQYTTAHGGSVGNGVNHEITSYDGKNYAYLNDTRLSKVTGPITNGTLTYWLGYDALGRCVRRSYGTTTPTSTTYYIYDGERPIYEFDPSGGTPSTNVYGRGIDEIIARSNNGAGQYPMQDRQGSVILVTGGDGTILESYRYDAFGAPTMKKPDGTVITTGASLINNRFLFTGREYAADFGFYEYRARAYHPGIGRFMSEDPGLFVRGMALGKTPDKWTFERNPDEAELNLFRYCNNDPWDLVDPLGLEFLGYDTAGDYFHEVGQVWRGYGHAVSDTVKGTAYAIAHPINTGRGIATAVADLKGTGEAIKNSVVQTWNSGSEGQGRVIGNVLIAIAALGPLKSTSAAGQLERTTMLARSAPLTKMEAAAINEVLAGANMGPLSKTAQVKNILGDALIRRGYSPQEVLKLMQEGLENITREPPKNLVRPK